ncbi:DUF3592 domain-containing protein [Gallaecimonas sp. GXIMD1310]|uniref:DUF3592 domain-containing protein n=1 Tax=Gallaecimonas sp. GXIMD1310 TaxID=3131926 RepID=UPI00324AE105
MQTELSTVQHSRWVPHLLLVPFVLFALIAVLMGGKLLASVHDRYSWLSEAQMTRGVVRQHLIKHVAQRFGIREKLQLAIYYNDNQGHWHEFISKSDLTEYNPFAKPPQVGERLWLYYLPQKPSEARLAGFNAFWLPVVIEAVFFGFSALLGFGPLLYLWSRQRRNNPPRTS